MSFNPSWDANMAANPDYYYFFSGERGCSAALCHFQPAPKDTRPATESIVKPAWSQLLFDQVVMTWRLQYENYYYKYSITVDFVRLH